MKYIAALFLSLSLITSLSAEIKEINQMTDLENAIGQLAGSDWLFFDIDYTLIEPKHPVLHMNVIKQNKQLFKDELASFTEEQKMIVPVLMVTYGEQRLIEANVPSLIKKLQNQNIPVMGFTALDTAHLPEIGSLPAWRTGILEQLGVNFRSFALPVKGDVEFLEFPPFRGSFPLYKDGILYTNVIPSKGQVLRAFLSKIMEMPARIILIDDSLENLQSVEKELQILGIPFLGIHYKAKVDPAKIPQVSESEWRQVWDRIHEKADFLTAQRLEKYVFRPYDRLFPSLFNKEKERIASHLPNAALIEHVGSTAVLDLGGKGIIDIAIAVEKGHMSVAKQKLHDIGYKFKPLDAPDRLYAFIDLEDKNGEIRRYHIHLTFISSKEWSELIRFRDYLRDNPAVSKEYADIKEKAAKAANQSGKIYREMKESLIQKIIAESKVKLVQGF